MKQRHQVSCLSKGIKMPTGFAGFFKPCYCVDDKNSLQGMVMAIVLLF